MTKKLLLEIGFWLICTALLIACVWKGLAKDVEQREALYEQRCDGGVWEHAEYCNGFYSRNALAASYGEVQ